MKAGCLYLTRNYPAAIQVSDKLLALNLPSGWSWRTNALVLLGRHAEAVRSLAHDLGTGSTRSAETIAQRADTFVKRYEEAGLDGPLGDLLRQTSGDVAAIPGHVVHEAR
jgi:hypothetical protein